ncbi:MAG: ATP-binding cassette domain-containing protein [Kiritimatiellia bacterium]|nr:ATP-binding cassette domain-containing protein [Kiritimatiellia bacterium]
MALLSVKNVSLNYGGTPLLDDVELHIEKGDRICLLGVNGTGKSSLLRILAGEAKPDSGQVIRSTGLRLARLPQQVPSHLQGRVLEIVCAGATSAAADQQDRDARQIISRLNLDPDADFETLSGGTQRRVLLARTLSGAPDVVLLDEPTNHLDLDSIAWLETFLLRYSRTMLFVPHDRSFLRRLASRVVELDRGRLSNWHCDYDTFLCRKAEFLDAEAKQWQGLDRRLKQEEEWRRQGVKARTVRNQGRVRALEDLRAERRRRRERTGAVQMAIQEADRTGQIVIKAEHVSFGFADLPMIRDFSTVIARGDKVGILGPNGCGKTTLLRLLFDPAAVESGLAPLSGRITHGTNLQIAYADQLRAKLDDRRSLAENIGQGQEFVTIQGTRRHVYGYLQDFLFTPDRARQPVGVLSGGERNRLLLARLFAQPSNLLVLDEPTNDLDLDTLELLEEQLAAYNGTVLLVSHDRTFLNNVVTGTLVFEKHSSDMPGQWLGSADGWFINDYVGGYDDWAERRLLPPEPEPAKKTAPPRREPAAKERRLSEREKRELAGLPGRIEALESEQAQWHAQLADPDFYRKDGESIARVRQRSKALAIEIETVYRQWEELEAALKATGG